jgi:membrane protease YdiL (CAAX protease family)
MLFEHNVSAVLVTAIVIALYGLYYGIVYTKVSRWIYRTFAAKLNETVFHAVFFRLSGFVIFGLGTAFIFYTILGAKFNFLSLQIDRFNEILPWIFVLFLIAIIIPYINVRMSKQSQYPQFKINKWTNSYKWLSYITWTLYLMGYEFMFRGVLLFGTVESFGYYLAVILNVVLYAFVHIPKGKKEVLGCFILGPILCITALETNTIFVPIVLHIAVCLTNEYFSIRKLQAKQTV